MLVANIQRANRTEAQTVLAPAITTTFWGGASQLRWEPPEHLEWKSWFDFNTWKTLTFGPSRGVVKKKTLWPPHTTHNHISDQMDKHGHFKAAQRPCQQAWEEKREGGRNCNTGINKEGGGLEGCVSMTGINGLIMYLAFWQLWKGWRGQRAEEKGLTACHSWLKANPEQREERGLVCRAKCCK